MGVFWLTGKKISSKTSKKINMHITYDFMGRGFLTSTSSAMSDNTSNENFYKPACTDLAVVKRGF